jgi:hypothetical protein
MGLAMDSGIISVTRLLRFQWKFWIEFSFISPDVLWDVVISETQKPDHEVC